MKKKMYRKSKRIENFKDFHLYHKKSIGEEIEKLDLLIDILLKKDSLDIGFYKNGFHIICEDDSTNEHYKIVIYENHIKMKMYYHLDRSVHIVDLIDSSIYNKYKPELFELSMKNKKELFDDIYKKVVKISKVGRKVKIKKTLS